MESFAEQAMHREDTYGFISLVLREELRAGQIKRLLDADVFNLLADSGYDINLKFFRGKPLSQVEEELAVEFTTLFIGPGRHVPPYESVHTGDNGGYWGESTADFKNWVSHYGLEFTEEFESIPDHISVALEFMRRVVEQERLAWERVDVTTAKRCMEVEKVFFDRHIRNWVPIFCGKVIEASRLDFYRVVARLTRDFILEEEATCHK